MRIIKHAILAISAVLLVDPAFAQTTSYASKTIYYSDATKTVIVGREFVLCYGETVATGEQTAYYDIINGNCP